jgi:nuclear cap-binding protein subunit 1
MGSIIIVFLANPHSHLAEALLSKLRDRAQMAEISLQVDTMRSELVGSGLTESRAASRVRSITMQCVLMLGARSFSHFLNAIERYLKILQSLSNTPDAKFEMLEIVGTFWRKNKQNILIIFDKLMQYQIAEPSDVVSWAFEGTGLGEKSDGLSTFQWELMRMALDKSNGRVAIAQRRLVQQRKLDEEARAAKNAQTIGMDVDDIGAQPQGEYTCCPSFHILPIVIEPEEDSTELQKQTRAHQILVGEQKAVLSRALEGFVTVLGGTDDCLSESAWENRLSWTKKEWDTIETWGWFRHFARQVSSPCARDLDFY